MKRIVNNGLRFRLGVRVKEIGERVFGPICAIGYRVSDKARKARNNHEWI